MSDERNSTYGIPPVYESENVKHQELMRPAIYIKDRISNMETMVPAFFAEKSIPFSTVGKSLTLILVDSTRMLYSGPNITIVV